jgi:hypothetical protein
MLLDMRLLAVSDETAGSDRCEPMAVGLSNPLGRNGAMGPAKTATYITPTLGGTSCQLPTAASSPVTVEVTGRGADPAPGAGGLLAGSDKLSELASLLALRLPAS